MKNTKEESVGGSFFKTSDYYKNTPLSNALATTHEQVSDTLKEGTIEDTDDTKMKDYPSK